MAMALPLLALVAAAAADHRSVPLRRIHAASPPRWSIGGSLNVNGAVWPQAIYWSTVQVGTPPQSYPVAIDSGSSSLIISGKSCVGCATAPPNNMYDPATSSTSQPSAPYEFSKAYKTCDLRHPQHNCTVGGKIYRDEVSLAGLGPVSVSLGSILTMDPDAGQFDYVSGVLGFLRPLPSNPPVGSVFGELVATGKCDAVWAMCIHEGTRSNGTLTIGGVDERLSVSDIVYVPYTLPDEEHIAVHVASLQLGGITVPVGVDAFLDSGTNVLLLPTAVHADVQTSMCADQSLAHCAELFEDRCFTLTDAQIDAYPALSIQLDGVALNMASRDYLLLGSPLASSSQERCIGIRDGGSLGGSGFIIGDTTMMNYYLVYDVAQKRVGWGEVNRERCGSVDDEEYVIEYM